MPDAGRLSPLLWVGRRRMLDRLATLVADGAGAPLAEQVAALDRAALPVHAA